MPWYFKLIAVLLIIILIAGCTPANTGTSEPASQSASVQAETSQASAESDSDAIGRVIGVSCGPDYSLLLTEDGRLLTCGDYEKNILGEDYVPGSEQLKELDTDIASCAAGSGYCAAIKIDGSLYIWGTNPLCGSTTPVKVLDGVRSVSLSDSFLLALKTDGSLWAMGDNTYGQLAMGNTENAPAPIEVMQNVKKMCACYGFSLILKNDGTLMGCGLNLYKQFGDVSDTKTPFIEFGEETKYIMDVQSAPAVLKKDVADIAAGSSHIVVLDTNGDVWCSGDNMYGQAGDGYGENTVLSYIGINIFWRCVAFTKVLEGAESVFAGYGNSFALKKDGTLWAWGENSDGQLGSGGFGNAYTPVQVSDKGLKLISAGPSHTLAIKEDGTLWGWGDNSYGQLCNGMTTCQYNYVQVADHVTEVASSGKTTMFIKEDGTLYGCGNNDRGQLADGTAASSKPIKIMQDALHVAVGEDAVYCVKKDGSLWAWGGNSYGDAGNGHPEDIDHTNEYDFYREIGRSDNIPSGYKGYLVEPLAIYAPEQILSGVTGVYAGNEFGLALAGDGRLYGWGVNEASISFGKSSKRYLAAPTEAKSGIKNILNGYMVITYSGELWDWGSDPFSDKNLKAVKAPLSDVISAAEGFRWRMAVKADGTLWLWGNINEQDIKEPVQIDDHIAMVAGNDSIILLITDDGKLYEILQAYVNDFMTEYSPGKKLTDYKFAEPSMDGVRFALTADSGTGIFGQCIFVLKTDGTLWASGNNKYGQLGDGTVFYTPTQIS